jgi:putative DNA methylase
MSGAPISGDYVKAEGMAGRLGAKLMAIVIDGPKGRVYLPPNDHQEALAKNISIEWCPEIMISGSTQYLGVKPYGMELFSKLFTDRQLLALNTFSGLVSTAGEHALQQAMASGLNDDATPLHENGRGATAYAQAIQTYLGICVSRQANRSSTLNFWDMKGENVQQVFARQALSMTWDFVEGNPLSNSTGNFFGQAEYLTRVLEFSVAIKPPGIAQQADAQTQNISINKVISTDPPYYDNVPYADLSDFFYVWMRRSLAATFPNLFSTMAVPKMEELVAFAYRHKSKIGAEAFFLDGMTKAMHRLKEQAHPAFPTSIYYAFRQAETDDETGTASTGWDTFLDAVIRAGFAISGTWPMRTEYTSNLKTRRNALASSIVLICRPRLTDAPIATRREFLSTLKAELPAALADLQRGNVAPVDLAQASIGPGMAVYTRFAKVVDAEGKPLSVREALALINQTLDEVLSEQEGDFDSDTRWAVTWFDEYGFSDGEFGKAEVLAKAKVTAISSLVDAKIVISKSSKVRLLKPEELNENWTPKENSSLTVWEIVHHLIRALETGGENSAATLLNNIGVQAEIARELAYRLYTICERKKRNTEALSYNALVQSWPEVNRLAQSQPALPMPAQAEMFQGV